MIVLDGSGPTALKVTEPSAPLALASDAETCALKLTGPPNCGIVFGLMVSAVVVPVAGGPP